MSLIKSTHLRIHFLFWALLLAAAWCYNYPDILTRGPYSIHQWRQADCLSITQNYFMEDRPFLEPAIHWVGDADGRTVSECPLIYYTVAQLWQWFGKEYWMFRMIDVCLVFLGLWSLFRIALRIVEDRFWSVFIPLFLFTSPILAFYSLNFLADAPALGMAMTGGYLVFLGVVDQKKWAYYLAFLVFLLAGLIKISSMILFIALAILHVKYAISKDSGKVPRSPMAWLPYVVVVAGLYFWYRYAHWYNETNVSGIFLTGLFPIWELNGDQIRQIWNSLTGELLPAYFIRQGLWLLGGLFVLLLWNYKKASGFWLYLSILLMGGVGAFILLFYQAFTVHDYYLTNLLIIIPVLLLAVLGMIKNHYKVWFRSRWLKGFAGVMLCLLIYKTALTNRMKYSTDDPWLEYNFVVADSRLEYWKWFHYDYRQHTKAYETIRDYLRDLGISRTDRVLSFSDPSINITLYLMDQKGYSSFGYGSLTPEERMKFYLDNGVEYIILDETRDVTMTIAPYLGEKIGQYENVGVYRMKPL